MKPLTERQANDVYDVLQKYAGAPERERDAFICSQTQKAIVEWRFQGLLGFGGKLWNNGSWYVNCYMEHETPERLAIIKKTNLKLTQIRIRETP